MMTGRMNWLSRFAALMLAALFIVGGCTEQPVDLRSEQDAMTGEDPDIVFDDILGFLDSYASRGLPLVNAPTLTILSPAGVAQVQYIEPATSVDLVMMVQNWEYPQAGRSLTCSIDDGQYYGGPGGADGFTLDLEYTFADVPSGWHEFCCVLTDNGDELDNCAATDCVRLTIWRLCDYLSDPICADANPVSAEACLWDPNIDVDGDGIKEGHRRCQYGPVDAPDICLSKYDCACDDDEGGREICIDNTCVVCVEDSDCDDGDPCTIGSCNVTDGPKAFCEFEAILVDGATCCTSTATEALVCNDSDYCTSDLCTDIDPVTGLGHCSNPDAGFPDCCNIHEDCDDGDPCTANACLGHECRQGPVADPLCCNPANGDADCETGDACLEATCNASTNQCSWEELTYDEQVLEGIECCASHPDCMAGGIWEEEPADLPATLDYCQNGQCVHLLDPAYCECNEGEGCEYPCVDDGEECTTDDCDLGANFCVHASIEDCCITVADCNDSDVCTVDTCVDGLCVHDEKPVTECCNLHADCDDDNPCNVDACLSHVCHHGPNPALPNCCLTDDDCDDNFDCTTEACQVETHECIIEVTDPPPMGPNGVPKECCLDSSQCNDLNASTQDACLTYQCYHFQYDCQPGDLCDDYHACTADSCGDDNKCQFEWIDNCCTSSLACNLPPLMPATQEYACKEGICEGNQCAFADIIDCCQSEADCIDGNDCTTDICVNKKCKHVSIIGCCHEDVDCEDNNACTIDACVNDICTNAPDLTQVDENGINLCCNTGGDCADQDPLCTLDYCFDHHCYHQKIDDCCTNDFMCADENACTCDICLYGSCRHLPPDQASNYPTCEIPLLCCTVDGDCQTDNNPCTADACVDNLCTYTLLDPCTLDLPYVQKFNDCNNV